MKPTVGQTVFLLNVGNNARRSEQKLTESTVTKVGRKYFSVGEGWQAVQFDIETMRQKTDYSANWEPYFSVQEWEDKKEQQQLHDMIRNHFGIGRPSLPLETLRKIKALLQ